jgi:hypothetical protein
MSPDEDAWLGRIDVTKTDHIDKVEGTRPGVESKGEKVADVKTNHINKVEGTRPEDKSNGEKDSENLDKCVTPAEDQIIMEH